MAWDRGSVYGVGREGILTAKAHAGAAGARREPIMSTWE